MAIRMILAALQHNQLDKSAQPANTCKAPRLPDDEVNKKAVQALSIRYESGKPVIIADFQAVATVMQQRAVKACDQQGGLAPRDAFFRADPG